MAKILSIFNNKGGVGKTTYMYHVAHLLARSGKRVLMVDCDSQCNLTAYTLSEEKIKNAWATDGNSIFRVIEPVYEIIGDFKQNEPTEVIENLYITPGDLSLSLFEDRLGDTWNSAKGGSKPDLRSQIAIYRYIRWASKHLTIDLVLVDLGPNLGALNRVVLSASDYFIVPIAADMFSLKGTENLGNKLTTWSKEWKQIRDAYISVDLEVPHGKPIFLGYVIQQHNIRDNNKGMTKGWQIFADQIPTYIRENIVEKLQPFDQIQSREDYQLGKIPNLHSLIPYSLAAKKPIFDCNHREGLTGAHITTARESKEYFSDMINLIQSIL